MAKRIVMIPPFDVLTGNLSGKQNLQYAENNNPAYDAPNGTQGARNYVARYIGTKRSDGKTFFSVRRKNTAVLNGRTRMAMALTAVTAAIISKCKYAQDSETYSWSKIVVAYEYDRDHGTLPEGVDSVTKFANYYIRRMLRYYQERWFRQSASSPVELYNPFRLDSGSALTISNRIWVKFAPVLAYSQDGVGGKFFAIDGRSFFAPVKDTETGLPTWGGLLSISNPNLQASLNGIAENTNDKITYLGEVVYAGSNVVASASLIDATVKYSTVQA